MSNYAKILPSLWTGTTGKRIRKLGSEAQVVAFYLMTSPHATMLGLYRLPMAYACADLGWTTKAIEKTLRSLYEIDFCAYDEETEMVWVYEMAFYQIATRLEPNDKQCKAVAKAYATLPDNPYLENFFEKYSPAFHLQIKRTQAPSKALPHQYKAPSWPLIDAGDNRPFVVEPRPFVAEGGPFVALSPCGSGGLSATGDHLSPETTMEAPSKGLLHPFEASSSISISNKAESGTEVLTHVASQHGLSTGVDATTPPLESPPPESPPLAASPPEPVLTPSLNPEEQAAVDRVKRASQRHTQRATLEARHQEAEAPVLRRVFAYYVEKFGHHERLYTLTAERMGKGRLRLRDALRMADGDMANAEVLMMAAIDELALDDWHNGRDPKTAGKNYTDWSKNLFNSDEMFQKWVGRSERAGRSQAEQQRNQRHA